MNLGNTLSQTLTTDGRRAKGRHISTRNSTNGWCIYLLLHLVTSPFLSLLRLPSVNFTLNWTSHNSTPSFLVKTPFFLLLFIILLLQNMYRLFRTTTKIQYPIYMHFFLFNNYQFIGPIFLEASLPSDCSKSIFPSGLQSIWVGFGGAGVNGWGTNKYIG